MVRPIIETSSVTTNPSLEKSCVRMEPDEPYKNSVRQIRDERRPFCPANRERDLLNQDLEMFWAQQQNEIYNSTGFHAKIDLPLARIRKIMKSDRQVKMVSADSPVLLAKASELFIQEVTLRAWRETQSSSRNTIQTRDIYKALKDSKIYDELLDLVSFEGCSANYQGVPQGAVSQQVSPYANVSVLEMKAPIDIDQIQEKSYYNLTAEDYIDTGEAFIEQ